MRNLTERDQRSEVWHGIHPRDQKRAASVYFRAGGLVLRRRTANRIGDHHVFQRQPIVRSGLIPAFTQAEGFNGRVEQISRPVARKGASGFIGACPSGRKSDDQEFCIFISETGNGRIEPFRFACRVLFAIGFQSRAQGAVQRCFWRK